MELKVFLFLAILENCFSLVITAFDIRELTRNAFLPGHTFLSLPGISLQSCWTNCENRVFCKSINYKRLANLCQLNSVGDLTVLQKRIKGSVFYRKQDDTTKVQCGNNICDGNMEVCDISAGSCSVKECKPLLESEERYIEGNMASMGDKALMGCNNGFSPSTGSDVTVTSECGSGGTWLSNISCIKTCSNGLRPSSSSETSYEELDNDVWITMPCAGGTRFSIDTCSCSITLSDD